MFKNGSNCYQKTFHLILRSSCSHSQKRATENHHRYFFASRTHLVRSIFRPAHSRSFPLKLCHIKKRERNLLTGCFSVNPRKRRSKKITPDAKYTQNNARWTGREGKQLCRRRSIETLPKECFILEVYTGTEHSDITKLTLLSSPRNILQANGFLRQITLNRNNSIGRCDCNISRI